MTTNTALDDFYVGNEIFQLRPDYAAFLVTATGLDNGPSDDESRRWLIEAAKTVDHTDDSRLQAWRDAYRDCGIKAKKYRPSVEALLRRIDAGLPEINKVVDAYNAISVAHCLPIGGEDMSKYVGPARLIRALGGEIFEGNENGEIVGQTVDEGEVVWRDDQGVTCRRWSWRQCVRTRVEESTTDVFFALERLEPMTVEELRHAGEELVERLHTISPDCSIQTRLVTAENPQHL